MLIQPKTSKIGYHATCPQCCAVYVWVDTTDGYPPGPDLCGQDCYDDWCDDQRGIPAWATED